MNTNINSDTPENYSLQPHNGTTQAQPQTEPKPFLVKTVSSWLHGAKAKPPITPLFDAFWQRGELAFLFGSTNVGKSILAVQIADAISKGADIQEFDGPQEPMKVCYFDFELSTREFLRRYSNKRGNVHYFSPNFLRAEIDAKAEIPKGIDYILERIENTIIHNRIEVAVIDNLSLLASKINKPKYVLRFMRELLLLKSRNNISMLVVCPELIRHNACLAMYSNEYFDSAFSIKESAKGDHLRYLIQESSSGEFKYNSYRVPVFQLVKRNRFLGFEHIGFGCESEHLCESSYW